MPSTSFTVRHGAPPAAAPQLRWLARRSATLGARQASLEFPCATSAAFGSSSARLRLWLGSRVSNFTSTCVGSTRSHGRSSAELGQLGSTRLGTAASERLGFARSDPLGPARLGRGRAPAARQMLRWARLGSARLGSLRWAPEWHHRRRSTPQPTGLKADRRQRPPHLRRRSAGRADVATAAVAAAGSRDLAYRCSNDFDIT